MFISVVRKIYIKSLIQNIKKKTFKVQHNNSKKRKGCNRHNRKAKMFLSVIIHKNKKGRKRRNSKRKNYTHTGLK